VGIVEERNYQPLGPEDPDDYRPNSRIAFVFDPDSGDGRFVRSLGFIFEECAPGDYVPLHTHTFDEAIIIDEGTADVRLGDDKRLLNAGAVVFIPAGLAHAWGNPGSTVLRAHAVFPSDVLNGEYLERNPAPGTEGDVPQPPFSIDLRAV
jgi:mannose-6-phosphate isomerase-like protein (cupin superfamily)